MQNITKTEIIQGILLNIEFEILPQHKQDTPVEFVYKIQIKPRKPITYKKVNRILYLFNLKIISLWHKDITEYTTHKTWLNITKQKKELIFKGEMVKFINISIITNESFKM